MTRYIAKPVRFWLAHALVVPLLTVFVLLVPIYFFTILWPGALGWQMDGHLILTFFLGAIVAAYMIGAGLAAIYSALLALWHSVEDPGRAAKCSGHGDSGNDLP